MLSEKLGHVFDKPLKKIAVHVPFSPNFISFTGFAVTLFASYVLISDLRLGGVLILAGGVFDILDGVVARTNQKESRFGAFWDSLLDRYSDAAILIAISWTFLASGNIPLFFVSIGILVGSFLVSYARARAEGLGLVCKQGLMERTERIVMLAAGAISGFLVPVLWVMLVLTHFTVFQRIYVVWKAGRSDRF